MPQESSLHEIFAARAQENPNHVAVIAGDQQITYGELNKKSDRLARRLIRRGVKREDIVGICVDRSIEMIVGLLAILKAGGAYLPIDPIYPKNRIRFLIEDSQAALVLTVSRVAVSLEDSGVKIELIDDQDQFLDLLPPRPNERL